MVCSPSLSHNTTCLLAAAHLHLQCHLLQYFAYAYAWTRSAASAHAHNIDTCIDTNYCIIARRRRYLDIRYTRYTRYTLQTQYHDIRNYQSITVISAHIVRHDTTRCELQSSNASLELHLSSRLISFSETGSLFTQFNFAAAAFHDPFEFASTAARSGLFLLDGCNATNPASS